MALQFARAATEMLQLHDCCDDHVGAVVIFNGRVRRINHDKLVSYLHYEAYEPLAAKEFAGIVQEAKMRFKIVHAEGVHRLGVVEVGGLAVSIVVHSIHRKEAFLAAAFVMDELKKRVPIWKKEVYEDLSFAWDKGFCGCIEERA